MEGDPQRDLHDIDTGVEKGEEEEEHLQQVINANLAANNGAKVEQVYIPTPDASKVWPEYKKYYKGTFVSPASYIRGSATVEDTCGVLYCMDEIDADFLEQMNAKISSPSEQCTEDEFEFISDKFESYTNEKQPFLSMDPSNIASLEEMSKVIINQMLKAERDPTSPEFLLNKIHNKSTSIYAPIGRPLETHGRSHAVSFRKFSSTIYPHWKNRRLERGGKPIFPTLKFEDQNASEKENDNDPYVCFRRREVRQVRKTRRADQQSSERLRKLQAEMEAARRLVAMVVKREELRKEALKTEWDIFEKRSKVKALKRQLGIKGDDEDLVNHKKKKTIPEEQVATGQTKQKEPRGASPAVAAQSENSVSGPMSVNSAGVIGKDENAIIPPNVRLPASKIPDLEMLTIEQVLHEKETMIRNAVKGKLKIRQQNDREWVNYTDNPFVPYSDYFDEDQRKYVPIIDGKHAAYSSISSPYPPSSNIALKLPLAASLGSSYANRVENPPVIMRASLDENTGDLSVLSKMSEKELHGSLQIQRNSAVSLRKRRGRGGRVFVDRRGLMRPSFDENELSERVRDRYKYDDELHTDNMEFSSNDPSMLNNISEATQSIRFGSMLLSKAYESYREACQARQQQLLNMQKMASQREQLNAAADASSGPVSNTPPVDEKKAKA